MGSGYLVVSVDGTAPQSAPVPHRPTRSMRAGQVLVVGDDFLLHAGTRLVLVSDERREILAVEGPNRLTVRAGAVEAYDPVGLTCLAPAYFDDPRTAVETTAQWLRDQRWVELARRYDLTGTDVALSSLVTGSFFVREAPREVGHPGGFGRYVQPFAPSFSYLSHRPLEGGDVEVTVQIRIEQGDGMVQEGRDSFRLRATAGGLQLLPRTDSARPAPRDDIHTA